MPGVEVAMDVDGREDQDNNMALKLIEHIFLPLRLPGSPGNVIHIERCLLRRFSTFLSDPTTESLFNVDFGESDVAQFAHVQKLFDVWSSIQGIPVPEDEDTESEGGAAMEPNPAVLFGKISSLETGDSFAFYVREQNATILVDRPGSAGDRARCTFSSFIASQDNRSVMTADGDLVAEFPRNCVDIPLSDLLQSDAVAKLVVKLSSSPNLPTCAHPQNRNTKPSKQRSDDVANPVLVTEYLTSTLADRYSVDYSKGDSGFLKIVKKIRDEVVAEPTSYKRKMVPKGKPFRRSGLWMSIKVILQLELVNRFGEQKGKLFYKLLMVLFMNECCENWCLHSSDNDEMTTDLIMQMIGKVARRLAKLSTAVDQLTTEAGDQRKCFENVRDRVVEILTKIRRNEDNKWADVIKTNSASVLPVRIPTSSTEETTIHNLQHFASNLHQNGMEIDTSTERSQVPPAAPRTRFRPDVDGGLFPAKYFRATKDEQLLGLILYDFERWVLQLETDFLTSRDCKPMLGILEAYIPVASGYYCLDPVGTSRFVLTCLKLVQLFDALAVDKCPQLDHHRSGVSAQLVQALLAPTCRDVEECDQVEAYFSARGRRAQLSSLIEDSEVTDDSFAVLYAATCPEMVRIKDKLLGEMESKCKRKREQVDRQRNQYSNLKRRERDADHVYHNSTADADIGKFGKCVETCNKCALKKRLRDCAVKPYEKPLPDSETQLLAIAFELLIPVEVACLREALYSFYEGVCGANMNNNTNVHFRWTVRDPLLTKHHKNKHQNRVMLGSTTKPDVEKQEILYGIPVAGAGAGYDPFIRSNPHTCHYAVKVGRFWNVLSNGSKPEEKVKAVKDRCTFEVQRGSPYSLMQSMLTSTNHSQNDALAAQSNCPQNLSLSEWREFGSLRAGHRLQYRNLYRAIALGGLTFSEESVLSLVCQVIWEVGPSAAGKIRESHEDVNGTDPHFKNELLTTLEGMLDRNQKNWNEQYILLIIVLLSNRILTGNKGHPKASALTKMCRITALKWVTAIESILSKRSPDGGSAGETLNQQNQLRLKLVEIAATGALTFQYVTDEGIITDSEDFALWFLFITTIDDNILLANTKFDKLPAVTRNLLRWVRSVGVDIEDHFRQRPDRSKVLGHFVQKRWPLAPAQILDNGVWKQTTSLQWYTLRCTDAHDKSTVLQVDIVLGKFLVDGQPIGRLPAAITKHPMFKRMFGDYLFVVQSTMAGNGGTAWSYVTCDRYHGCVYRFQQELGHEAESSLIVTEVEENDNDDDGGDEWKLLSHELFESNVPRVLAEEFSHWGSTRRNVVQFRSTQFQTAEFRTNIKYEMDLATGVVYDLRGARVNEHARSRTVFAGSLHTSVTAVMTRLESTQYIHVFVKKDEQGKERVEIELPRMGLHFDVSSDGGIFCREYRGFQVQAEQNLETLIGLKQGLLMARANSNSIFLLPHGTPIVTSGDQDNCSHQTVLINTLPNLRTPPFFAIEVDHIMRRLKTQATLSAWLYLTHLHALTSSPLPDPFTGLTGYENAIQLLQSPLCWSCEPLDVESALTLKSIASLSPVVRGGGELGGFAQAVTWPANIPAVCAHPAYAFLAHKLSTDSKRTSFTCDDDAAGRSTEATTLKGRERLAKRAYWRHEYLYSPQARISPQFNPGFDMSRMPKCVVISSLKMAGSQVRAEHGRNIQRMYAIHQLIDMSNHPAPTFTWNLNPDRLLKTVCDASEVRGAHQFHPERWALMSYASWIIMDYTREWLVLYNYARQVHQQTEWRAHWTLMLAARAYFGSDYDWILFDHLKILQAIAMNPSQFENLNPPAFDSYNRTGHRSFDSKELSTIVSKARERFRKPVIRQPAAVTARAKDAYEAEGRRQISRIMDYLEANFQALDENTNVGTCNITSAFSPGTITQFPDLLSLNESIRCTMRNWQRNQELWNFMNNVVTVLRQLNTANAEDSVDLSLSPLPVSSTNEAKLAEFVERTRFDVTAFWLEKINFIKLDPDQEPSVWNGNTQSIISTRPVRSRPENSARGEEGEDEYPLEYDITGAVEQDALAVLEEYSKDLCQSWNTYIASRCEREANTGHMILDLDMDKATQLQTHLRRKDNAQGDMMGAQILSINGSPEMDMLRAAGLLFRPVPVTLLPLLLPHRDHDIPARIRSQIENLAQIWTLEQTVRRCLRMVDAGPSMELALQLELSTIKEMEDGNKWSPSERPEWLLLQLEMDILIRAVQVDVAEKMAVESGPHSLMQLNMGEGKTSVIIPMLVSRLANGQQLCRVTVLRSLYTTNKKMLAYSIGGLLGQRVYTFPCRRDVPLDSENVAIIQNLYEECEQFRGVAITVPEHRLSFQLKAYEKCRQGEMDVARGLVKCNAWLRANARDLLDECDEILNVKYQLVYTVGEQQPVSGGQDRWKICQNLLRILPRAVQSLLDAQRQQNPNARPAIEFQRNGGRFADLEFPHCRILNDKCYAELCKRLAEDVLDGKSEITMPELPAPAGQNRARLLEFLTNPAMPSQEEHIAVLWMFKSTLAPHLNTILAIRGLLVYGVLLHCLTRRWRVNYGVNPNGPKLMAVPFRAKDVASERTEFGHTDVAILLTQLSYYYSGLSEDQVRECFQFLSRYDDKELQYNNWLSGINVDSSIASLRGVNLADYSQTMTNTVPTLRRNMRVIDFWLSHAVYPKESKQFPQKLCCTPWDLCTSEIQHPVTGFSGTNDTKLLLPLTISQEELPSLGGTNGQVLHNLLRTGTSGFSVFPLGISGVQMLDLLVAARIPLLLDVGALMIDLSNESVAREWLRLDPRYKAAVYFSESDEILVMDNEGRTAPFNLSPYRTNLDVCLIYLDDVHTRGTDLQIPRGTRGAVTLGKGVTKDKLVQGCMRMRMLGNGHTAHFYASQEVSAEIQAIAPQTPPAAFGAKEVMLWALHNSCVVTRDGFQHWVGAAANFYAKTGATAVFQESGQSDDDLKLLGSLCGEDETLELLDLYGSFRQKEDFPIISRRRMNLKSSVFARDLRAAARIREDPIPRAEQQKLAKFINNFDDGVTKVVKRCWEVAADLRQFTSMLDEEQERELEREQEEVQEKLRPEPANAAPHHMSKELERFIKDPLVKLQPKASLDWSWYVSLPYAVEAVGARVQATSWGEGVFATRDFSKVVTNGGVDSEHMRPVTWLVSKTYPEENRTIVLLLSPYEANKVKNLFMQSSGGAASGTFLHMFAARLHPEHSTFWTTPALALPSHDRVPLPIAIRNIEILNANLLIFSGSLFFRDEDEQAYYCHLLGFVPTPRSQKEQDAAAEGLINAGWVVPEARTILQVRLAQRVGSKERNVNHYGAGAAAHCKFAENPEPLVQAIIKCRHEILPESSHVSKILLQSKKTFLSPEDCGDSAMELGEDDD